MQVRDELCGLPETHRYVAYVFWSGVLVVLTVVLAGFWILLSYRYSPETYRTVAAIPGTVEFTWFGIGILIAVVVAVEVRRTAAGYRRLLRVALPVAVVGALVVVKSLAGMPVHCIEPMLFSAGCGWTVVLALKEARWKFPDERLLVWSVCAGTVVLAGYYYWQQRGAWRDMALGYADCGEMARLMYNTVRNPGELFLRVNPEKPLFYDHFQPGILPLVLLGGIWPSVEMTIVLQVLAILGTGVPIYLIGRDVLQDKAAGALLAAGWLVYPATSQLIYSSSYGFNFGNFRLPLYFLSAWLWLRGRNIWSVMGALWALLIKEEAAIVLGMFGLYLFLFERRHAAGAVMAASCFGYFLVISTLVIPAFNPEGYRAMGYFSHLGSTKLQILLAPVSNPALFWGKLFEPATVCFAGALVAPLLFLPLKKTSALFIGSLTFLFVAIWYNPMGKSISFWYQTALLPVVFLALVLAVRDGGAADPPQRRAMLTGVVTAGSILSIFLGNTFWSKPALAVPTSPGRLELVKRIGAAIDRDATLVASQRVAAHFVSQKYLYLEPALPAAADFVFLDLRDRWRRPGDLVWLRHLRTFQRKVEFRSDLHLTAAEDGLLLYTRSGLLIDAKSLVETESLPPDLVKTDIELGYGIRIIGLSFEAMRRRDGDDLARVRVRIFSAAAAPLFVDLAARCILRFDAEPGGEESFASEFQPLGQGIWPTYQWVTGKFHVDEFIVLVPEGLEEQPFSVGFEVDILDGYPPS